jgi:hypothetical protein
MIHRAVSVSIVSKKKRYEPKHVACERRQFIAPACWRVIVQVVMGHQPVAVRAPATSRSMPSATFCKAACINTQQTVKNDVNLAFGSGAVQCGTFYDKASIQTSV